MRCPACNSPITDRIRNMYCPSCGTKLSDEFGAEMQKMADKGSEIASTPDGKVSFLKSEDGAFCSDPGIQRSSAPGNTDIDVQEEYRRAVEEVLTSGQMTTERISYLVRKKRELGLEDTQAIALQKEVAAALKIGIDDESVLQQGHLLIEIDKNACFLSGNMGQLELRVTNISDENIGSVRVTGFFGHLPAPVTHLRESHMEAHGHKVIRLPVNYSTPGTDSVDLTIDYSDAMGNPSVYSTSLKFQVFKEQPPDDGAKSVSITIQAEKVIGNDLSRMVEVHAKEQNKDQLALHSFIHEGSESWVLLPLYFEREETDNRRKAIEVKKNYDQAESLAARAQMAKESGNKLFQRQPSSAKQPWQESLDLFEQAASCYSQVLFEDPGHSEAMARIQEIRRTVEDLRTRLKVPVRAAAPKVRTTSATITIPHSRKRIFLFSKDRVTIGRNNSNDIVLRLVPYEPQDQFQDNFLRTSQISGVHAQIISRNGIFYLSDTGKDGKGSMNGTFLYGKRIKPGPQEYQLRDGSRINIAGVLELETNFIWSSRGRKTQYGTSTKCLSVFGEEPASCFGIDIDTALNAVRLIRTNNFTDGEEYLIVVRGFTIGRSTTSGVVVDAESVSDIHGEIFYRDSQYWLVDRNSRHGTWMNGSRLEPGAAVPLSRQAEIVMGQEKLHFEGQE